MHIDVGGYFNSNVFFAIRIEKSNEIDTSLHLQACMNIVLLTGKGKTNYL